MRLQHGAGNRRRRELEGSERCDSQWPARRGLARLRRGDGNATRLSDQLDQDDGRHHRVIGKVSLKIKVVRARDAAARGALTVNHLDDLLQEPHRRPMRQAVNPGRRIHRGLLYTFLASWNPP